MSFFGHLLAGVAGGAADGYSAGLAQQEKADLQRQMQAERQQASMDRQQMQNDFRLLLEQDKADRKGSGGGGNGAGRDMLGDVLDFMKKGDQEGLNKYIDAVSAFDATAADQLRSTLLKKQPVTADMTTSWPTEKDVLAAMGDPAAMVPEVPKNASRGEKERVLGEQALTKLAVIFRDPAKLDTYAKGERQFALNQFGAGVAEDKLRKGGSLEDAATGFSKYSAPEDESGKDARAAAAIADRDARDREKSARAAEDRESREIIAKLNALTKAQGRKVDSFDEEGQKEKARQVAKLQEELDALQARRDAREGAAYAPNAPKTVVTPAVTASPASRAAAWKSKFGVAQ